MPLHAPFRVHALACLAAIACCATMLGCQTSRFDQLRAKSDKVESNLRKERNKVLAAKAPDSAARISHLTSLHTTLSLTNVALGTVPLVVPEQQRTVAYDVIDEAYSTIDWNIPLGPDQPQRPMPAQLQSGMLRLN